MPRADTRRPRPTIRHPHPCDTTRIRGDAGGVTHVRARRARAGEAIAGRPCQDVLVTQPLAVGFDLDLTLVDSRERIINAYQSALHDVGAPVSREVLEPHLGVPLLDAAAAVAPAVDADAFVARYRRHYDAPDAPVTEPMPGAAAALEAVRAVGGRTVVVSAKYLPAVHKALDEAGLTALVDAVYGDVFAEDKATALAAEGVTIYVGDHPGDMVAAAATPAYAVGVTTGSNDSAALRAAGAELSWQTCASFRPGWRRDSDHQVESGRWKSDGRLNSHDEGSRIDLSGRAVRRFVTPRRPPVALSSTRSVARAQ